MGNPFLALIVPMGDGAGIGGGHPSHPWVPPGNYPDQGLPGSQPRPDQGLPPFASHPIVIPGVPDPLPGSPSHPIYIPGGHPSHPIPAFKAARRNTRSTFRSIRARGSPVISPILTKGSPAFLASTDHSMGAAIRRDASSAA